MTIDEAIRKLAELKRYAAHPGTEEAYQALQLGIEALAREKHNRGLSPFTRIGLLPGETG